MHHPPACPSLLAPTDAHHSLLGCSSEFSHARPHRGWCPLALLFVQREPNGGVHAMGQVGNRLLDIATWVAELSIPASRGRLQPLSCPPNPPAAPAWRRLHHREDQV